MTTCITTLTLAFSLCAASLASAAITGTTGAVVQIGPPPSCVPTALTSNTTASTWDEQQGTAQVLKVDMINSGPSAGAIPGTVTGVMDSHFIHLEIFGGLPPVIGTVTFDKLIIGVIFTAFNLDNSDTPAGAFGTVYPTTYPFRGLNTLSFFSVSGSTISINLSSLSPATEVFQIRVLTQVPAPAGAAAIGLAGVVALRRRRAAV